MSGAEEDRKRAVRAEQVALFRYQLIREAADPALSTRQRGLWPASWPPGCIRGRSAMRWWCRGPRSTGGFGVALRRVRGAGPAGRQVTPRTDAQVLELAAGLKRERPARTAAQVARVLRASCGWSPSAAPCSGTSRGWS